MEWVLVGVGVLVFVLWRLARRGEAPAGRTMDDSGSRRTPVGSPGAIQAGATAVTLLTAVSSRGVVDPDNPDGSFMDGYVAGRYSGRADHRYAVDGAAAGRSGATSSRLGDEDDDDAVDDDMDDDAWGGSWSSGSGDSLHRSHDVWSDPDDAFHDDSLDDW